MEEEENDSFSRPSNNFTVMIRVEQLKTLLSRPLKHMIAYISSKKPIKIKNANLFRTLMTLTAWMKFNHNKYSEGVQLRRMNQSKMIIYLIKDRHLDTNSLLKVNRN
jgi:hypothetical protein